MVLKLFYLDYNLERLKEIQSKISDLCIHCDVTNKKSVKKCLSIKFVKNMEVVDILISNAGTAPGGAIGEVSERCMF